METAEAACGLDKAATPFQRKLTSRGDVKARSAVLKVKKRHVEEMTRLPTKRMATACWGFIVAKSTPLKPAPMLVFRSLRHPNRTKLSTAYEQVLVWLGSNRQSASKRRPRTAKCPAEGPILSAGRNNPVSLD
jgi:hypothetical protein